MSIILNILAAVGLLVIISYVIYYLYDYLKNVQIHNDNKKLNPPGSYMQNTGLMCPDYWVNAGVDNNGNYICKNEFNIPVNNNSNCNSQQMLFTPIPSGQTWEYGNPNNLTSMTSNDQYNFLNNSSVSGSISRCAWINQCGPNATTQGIWQGVNEMCNSPPQSS
jgi:hypothetical protein